MRIRGIRQFQALCAVAVALAGLPGTAHGQASPPPEPRAVCREARPASECRVFLVVEGRLYPIMAGSRYPYQDFPVGGRPGPVEQHMELAGYLAYEVGAMMNTASNRAVGATVQLGGDETGRRVAVKGRYRRWLGRAAAWDVGAGVVATRQRVPGPAGEPGNEYVPAVGLAAEVSLGLTEWVGIGVEGDLLFSSGGRDPATGLYAGVKLGGTLTRIVTAAGVIIGAVLYGGATIIGGGT